MTHNYTFDSWFKTWPVRVKKESAGTLTVTPQVYEKSFKNHIMSLDILPDMKENGNILLSTYGPSDCRFDKTQISDYETTKNNNENQNVSLDCILESLPLVYNPSTKQLQVVKLKSGSHKSVSSCTSYLSQRYRTRHRVLNTNNNEPAFVEEETFNLISNCIKDENCDGHVLDLGDKDDLKSSRTKDNEGRNALLTCSFDEDSEDSLQPSESYSVSLSKNCSPVSTNTSYVPTGDSSRSFVSSCDSKKKKGFTEIFTRNLFPWRSKREEKSSSNHTECGPDSSLPSATPLQEETGYSAWKIFSKGETPVAPDPTKVLTHEQPAGSAGLIMEERPGNLPAKTPLEQEKHLLEYKNIVTAAKKKEIKEAKERRKAQALLLKQEKQLSDSVHTWNTVILPKWITMRNHKTCQDLWWSGLPSCIRGKVWKLAIGNELNITPQLYSRLVQRSLEKLSSLMRSKSVESEEKESCAGMKDQESTLKLIEMDVSRTFPHLCIFQNGGPFHDPLHNILGAYVCYRPDIGYVQGMSFLAATLLLNMEESDAFIFFANLVNRTPHSAFFSVDQRLMQAYYMTFERVLRENHPQLASHLHHLNVSPSMYFLDWVLTVFSRSFPLDVAARMWDIYLRDGEEFLFRAAVGILKHFEKDLLSEDCTARTAQFLTRLPEDLNVEALFRDVASVPLTIMPKKSLKDLLQENVHKTSGCV